MVSAPVPLGIWTWSADRTAVEYGDPSMSGDLLMRQNLALSSGASMVGFLQTSTGMVSRTLRAKDREVVHADDAVWPGTRATKPVRYRTWWTPHLARG